jgi:D-alanyl-D-alanine carboxypeptidase
VTRTLLLLTLAATIALAACGDDDDAPIGTTTPTPTVSTASPSASSETPAPPTSITTPEPSTDGATTAPATETPPPATNVTLLTPVDKEHSLPADYVPQNLASIPSAYLAPGFGGQMREDALDAMIALQQAAFDADYDIRCRSAYRSYADQEDTFNYWVSVLGYDEATRVSAMPGHSEHQLGSTCDLTSPEVGWDLIESFGDTAPGQWLVEHAHEYGFVLSYPEGKESVTGYSYEPWHWRYIGPEEAQSFIDSGLTLNQYLQQ